MKKSLAKTNEISKVAKVTGRKSSRAAGVPYDEHWDQQLGFLMHDVSRLRRAVFDQFMKPLGVTRSQLWVLGYLARYDGMAQSDLANLLDLGKAALGGLTDRLESSGFIERRADPADRRLKRVYLSAKGNRAVKKMRVKSGEMSERILAGLDKDHRVALTEMLQLIKNNLLGIRREEGPGRRFNTLDNLDSLVPKNKV